ncbi:MAG: T9SS type A sorting domain-containing protein [Ginsengibacter sp.]
MLTKIYLLLSSVFTLSFASSQTRPYLNAGPDKTARRGYSVPITGSASGVSDYRWKTTGKGIFSNIYALKTTYRPAASDIKAGKIALILYSPSNIKLRDTMILTIVPCPVVSIKAESDTICGYDNGGTYEVFATVSNPPYHVTWTTSGNGDFFYEDSAFNIYQFTSGDAGSGSVWLKATVTDPLGSCTSVTDSIYLKLNDPARMDLPDDGYISCGNDSILINGGISGLATTVYWSTTGTGHFSRIIGPTTVYYPSTADRFSGNIQISGVTNDPPGPCPAASDYANIEFGPYATTRPADTVICASRFGGTLAVSGVPSNENIYWSSDGFGFFDDEYSAATNYNYTASDVGRGNLELYFNVSSFTNCPDFTDTIRITLNEAPWLEFPEPKVTVCANKPVVNASVYVYGYASPGKWTTSGTGTFDYPGQTETIYRASAADIKKGCVNLYYTTGNPPGPCGSISGYMTACFTNCAVKNVSGRGINPVTFAPTNNKISLYPNPAKNIIEIKTGLPLTNKQIYITNILGKKMNNSIKQVINKNTLDVSHLSSGVYFLHIIRNDKTDVIKFVKQ